MSFYDLKKQYGGFDFAGRMKSVTEKDVLRALRSDAELSPEDFLALLSPTGGGYLEEAAQKARRLTKLHFGNVVFMFTPLYLSNYCDSACPYCSFGRQQPIARKQLSISEIRDEAAQINASGIRHILFLTGESRKSAPLSYLKEAVSALKKHFSFIGIEIYPMRTEEYAQLIQSGVDGLTLYQETYDEAAYAALHKGGPKADYVFRLEAPERALEAGMVSVNIGALLGLNDPIRDSFFTALHLRYLQDRFPAAELSISLPRLRPLVADFIPPSPVDDRLFVRILTAFRLFAPRAGITVSTRESAGFRRAILPMGVTRMSAGVCTSVGGRLKDPGVPQFEIADTRSVKEIMEELSSMGYQPVLCDWSHALLRSREP